MKLLRFLTAVLLSVLIPAGPVLSQQAIQDAEVVVMPTGETLLRWFGHQGRTYFIQASNPNDHLRTWIWSNLIDYADNQVISHQVGSTADKAFFRLHFTDSPLPAGVTPEDWDADGDGLSNALELSLQGNPLNIDTSGDGIPDGWTYIHDLPILEDNSSKLFKEGPETNLEAYRQGVQAHPNATIDNLDGDGIENNLDADPNDIDVDWERATVSAYALIELTVPTSPGQVRDLNDNCEVLFDNGLWSEGVWTELPTPDEEGEAEIPGSEYNPHTFNTNGHVWSHLHESGLVAGTQYFSLGAPGDFEHVPHVITLAPESQLASSSQVSPGWADTVGFRSLTPLGIDSLQRIFTYKLRTEIDSNEPPHASLLILNPMLEAVSTLPFDSSKRISTAAVSASGVMLAHTTPFGAGGPYQLKLWNVDGENVPNPLQADQSEYIYDLSVAELADGRVLATSQSFLTSRVGSLKPGEDMKLIPSLTGKNIRRFAGDGTAMTADHKMWINGELIPIRDLCPAYGDLLDDDFSFQVHKANKHGIYLIEAHKENQSLPMLLMPVEVVPDHNRDGMINDEDRGKVTDENPLMFWTNDDDDSNEEPHFGDVPGSEVDGTDMVVNGKRDLIDFFPIELRLKKILEILPAAAYSYTISHPTGAFHFIEMPNVQPGSSPEGQGAGSYLKNPAMVDEVMTRQMHDTAGQGTKLSAPYLDAAKVGEGILLFEAASETDQSFELIITKKNGGAEIARIPRALPLEMVNNPESMYWRLNIRPAAMGQAPGNVQEPANAKFKSTRKDQWFIFCHGYNVSEEAARGWNSEIFKRLHQEGSDARFVGVTWEGNQGQIDLSMIHGRIFTPDYWRNVYNAFASSHALATRINGLTGSSKSKTIIAGHSLGNMLVSSAICDYGLKAGQYFMFNSAVPREAYSSSYVAQDRGNMRNPEWEDYPTRLWSSDWKDLYASSDGRNKLTWQNRFTDLKDETTPFNYYSTGEDVAAGSVGGGKPNLITVVVKGSGAWISQEMNKGLANKAAVNGFATGDWNAGGGWGFNLDHYTDYRPNPLDPPEFPPGTPLPDTSEITENQLRANPFFKPFTKLKLIGGGANPAADGTEINSTADAAHASHYAIRAWMLAHEIPSLSKPTASGPLDGVGGAGILGANMEFEFKSGNWGPWIHSALKDQDHTQVWKLYQNMCDKGSLKKP
jgi:hypothetical protein